MKISYNSYYASLSHASDGDADKLYWMLQGVRGVKYTPRVFQSVPKWYERWKRKAEKTFICVVRDAIEPITSDFGFTEKQRTAYWQEIGRGQYPNEDAGGYEVRCINAVLTGEVTELGETYDQLVKRLLRKAK